MNSEFEILSKIIENRRTVKPALMNGKKIPEEQIDLLLQLADWAPTHKRTEPWRFLVYSGDGLKTFVEQHAELYRKYCPADKFQEGKMTKILKRAEQVSHLVMAVMKRVENHKIPETEEYAAVSAAIQNMLLGAAALNIAAIWTSGSMATSDEMKEMLQLGEEDAIVGMLLFGYTDRQDLKAIRMTPLEEKITRYL